MFIQDITIITLPLLSCLIVPPLFFCFLNAKPFPLPFRRSFPPLLLAYPSLPFPVLSRPSSPSLLLAYPSLPFSVLPHPSSPHLPLRLTHSSLHCFASSLLTLTSSSDSCRQGSGTSRRGLTGTSTSPSSGATCPATRNTTLPADHPSPPRPSAPATTTVSGRHHLGRDYVIIEDN